MTEEIPYYDVNITINPLHQITYNEVIDSLGDQVMYKFLIIGVVFLLTSYWDRCGMRNDWNLSGKSYPKLIMIHMFGEQAEERTKDFNEILNGLTSTLAIISISIYILYKMGV